MRLLTYRCHSPLLNLVAFGCVYSIFTVSINQSLNHCIAPFYRTARGMQSECMFIRSICSSTWFARNYALIFLSLCEQMNDEDTWMFHGQSCFLNSSRIKNVSQNSYMYFQRKYSSAPVVEASAHYVTCCSTWPYLGNSKIMSLCRFFPLTFRWSASGSETIVALHTASQSCMLSVTSLLQTVQRDITSGWKAHLTVEMPSCATAFDVTLSHCCVFLLHIDSEASCRAILTARAIQQPTALFAVPTDTTTSHRVTPDAGTRKWLLMKPTRKRFLTMNSTEHWLR